MTTDRELLALAAKAAGIEVDWRESVQCFCFSGSPYNVAWDPRTDSGQCFELAVKLGISVSYDRLDQGANERRVFAVHSRGVELEPLGTDPYAATRMAVVRAAAEIGRAMP